LQNLHKAVKSINGLDLGGFNLPDRFGLQDKDGETKAIVSLIRGSDRYEIELVNEEEIEQHKEEVRRTQEIDRSKQI
jgi:hypothetical protein